MNQEEAHALILTQHTAQRSFDHAAALEEYLEITKHKYVKALNAGNITPAQKTQFEQLHKAVEFFIQLTANFNGLIHAAENRGAAAEQRRQERKNNYKPEFMDKETKRAYSIAQARIKYNF